MRSPIARARAVFVSLGGRLPGYRAGSRVGPRRHPERQRWGRLCFTFNLQLVVDRTQSRVDIRSRPEKESASESRSGGGAEAWRRRRDGAEPPLRSSPLRSDPLAPFPLLFTSLLSAPFRRPSPPLAPILLLAFSLLSSHPLLSLRSPLWEGSVGRRGVITRRRPRARATLPAARTASGPYDSAIRPGGGPPVRLTEAATAARLLSSDSERGM